MRRLGAAWRVAVDDSLQIKLRSGHPVVALLTSPRFPEIVFLDFYIRGAQPETLCARTINRCGAEPTKLKG